MTTDSRPANGTTAPRDVSLAGSDSLNGQKGLGTQGSPAVEGSASPQATLIATTMAQPPAGDQHSHGQACPDTQSAAAVAAHVPGGHPSPVTHRTSAAGDEQGQPAAIVQPAPKEVALLADPLLALAADVLSDLETVRIANENRLRQLTRSAEDKDGETRGFGLDEAHPDVARLAALVAMLAQAEHQATLNLQRLMRGHPLGPWLKAQKGIGEKQGARLLATIGDPYIRPEITREDGTVEPSRPRLVSELWAYCGYHVLPASGHCGSDPQSSTAAGGSGSHPSQPSTGTHLLGAGVAARRRKGQRANWSAAAKMRAFLIAESCIKQMDGSYRVVYDAARDKHVTAIHSIPCERCGPQGHPAQPGTPLSAGHQHARALRAVAKTVLRDLWREARDIHLSA